MQALDSRQEKPEGLKLVELRSSQGLVLQIHTFAIQATAAPVKVPISLNHQLNLEIALYDYSKADVHISSHLKNPRRKTNVNIFGNSEVRGRKRYN